VDGVPAAGDNRAMAQAARTSPPGLEVHQLGHHFGDLAALAGVSLSVAAGEVVGLVGRNGAGKTTLMRSIMGIVVPDDGTIAWRGAPIAFEQRRRFGYMPEERGLYPQMQVGPQLRYLARLHGLGKAAAMRSTHAWLERLELGERSQEKLIALSHGNQQRVQLAAALVHDPELLVLDEPFAGLDPGAVDALSEILRTQVGAGTAVMFSSHQLELVERICDRIVVLDRGRVLGAGTLTQLREQFPTQLRVRVATPQPWAARLAGVRVVSDDERGTLLVVQPGTDIQAILHTAQAAGPVEHFGFETAGLIDLYRQLIVP
jgi:ABC-2 type transport system ATP-binding protein